MPQLRVGDAIWLREAATIAEGSVEEVFRREESGRVPLSLIEGRKLISVSFVLDYVELRFDEYGLTALAWPELFHGEQSFDIRTAGYRDALCGLIGAIVRETAESESL